MKMTVKRYKSSKEFQKDAKKMGRKGWSVVAQTQEERRPGCGRWLSIGIFAAVFPPKPILVVTYQKE